MNCRKGPVGADPGRNEEICARFSAGIPPMI